MNKLYIILLSFLFVTQADAQNPCPIILDDNTATFTIDSLIYTSPHDSSVTVVTPPPPPPDEGEFRKVITWVHGMNGSNASWGHGGEYARQEFEALPLFPDYSNFQATIATIRTGLEAEIRTDWEANKDLTTDEGKEKSFGIAHSLGGIVLRGVSEQYSYLDDKINGIITVNSPHGGSVLADYIETVTGGGDQEKIQNLKNFVANACKAFAIGPLEEKLSTNKFVSIIETLAIGFVDVADLLVDNGCDIITPLGVPLVVNNIAPKAVSELKLGSAALEIDENVPTEHKMLFYGNIVDDPNAHISAFKMFYSAQNDPNQYAQFDATSQTQEAIDEFQTNLKFYNDKYTNYRNWYEEKPWTAPGWSCARSALGILFCITWNEVKDIRNGYKRGRDKFRGVNDYWEYVTGARSYGNTGLGTCKYNNGQQVTVTNISKQACFTQGGLSAQWYANIAPGLKGYDGFLTVESQKAWDDVPSAYKYPLNSNHLQVKNDNNTKYLIDLALRGNGRSFFGQ